MLLKEFLYSLNLNEKQKSGLHLRKPLRYWWPSVIQTNRYEPIDKTFYENRNYLVPSNVPDKINATLVLHFLPMSVKTKIIIIDTIQNTNSCVKFEKVMLAKDKYSGSLLAP